MTGRRNLEEHRHSLNEIKNIMNSMKTLAFKETRKLSRFLESQQAAVKHIENVALDLLAFHPEVLPETRETKSVYILLGSERGFCGDFNYALIRHFDSILPAKASDVSGLLAVGHKLCTLLEGDNRVMTFIDGAGVVEEVTLLLERIVRELITLQEKYTIDTVYCLYHESEEQLGLKKILPPFLFSEKILKSFRHSPILNQHPDDLLLSLTDNYLLAALHEIIYTSMMVENHLRVAHLEGAVKRLDERSEELARKCNLLRQEEIIEEIEAILLSASSVGTEN